MGNRRFSLTTWVLVGLSLVALYFVGKTVTPPPPAPPKELTSVAAPKTPTQPITPSPEKLKLEETKATAEQAARAAKMRQMAAQTKSNPQANVTKFNPNSIDVDSKYWNDPAVAEGAKGEKIMRARVDAALEKEKSQPKVPAVKPSMPKFPAP